MEKSPAPAAEDARFGYERRGLDTLVTALGCTPIYESWRAFDPGEGHPVDLRYNSLPVLTKDDIRAHFPHGVVPRGLDLSAALARGEVSFVRTSGTADEALENIWNQQWWDVSERASWKLNSVAARVATGQHCEAILASALSVGSIMLARQWIRWRDPDDEASSELFDCLGFAPVLCDTHGEAEGWEELKALLTLSPTGAIGHGIASGTAIVVEPDGAVSALGGVVQIESLFSAGTS
jgi:hypothetical protein